MQEDRIKGIVRRSRSMKYQYNHPVMEDQDKNRIRELEEQITTLREELAKRDERIVMLQNLLQQQRGLGRGGI